MFLPAGLYWNSFHGAALHSSAASNEEVPHWKDEVTETCVCCSLWKCHLYRLQQLAVSLPSAFKLQINERVNELTCYSKGTKSSLVFDDWKCRSKCAEKLLVLYQRGEEIKENDRDKRKRYQPSKLTPPFLYNSEHVVILCDWDQHY